MTDATDDFSGTLSRWTMGLNSLVISAATVKGNTAADENSGWWNADAFGSNHYSQVKVAADADGGGPVVRHQSGANSYYEFYTDSASTCAVFEVTAGAYTMVGANYSISTAVNSVLKLDATGSTLTPSFNGAAQATRSDSTITGGAPGIHIFDTNCAFDDWLGGPIVGGAAQIPYNRWPQLGPILGQ